MYEYKYIQYLYSYEYLSGPADVEWVSSKSLLQSSKKNHVTLDEDTLRQQKLVCDSVQGSDVRRYPARNGGLNIRPPEPPYLSYKGAQERSDYALAQKWR